MWGCTSTSGVDTTLGSVGQQSAAAAPLPAPAEPGTFDGAAVDTAPAPLQSLATSAPTAPPPPPDLVPQVTLRNTGTFPDLREPPEPRIQQFTDEEQAQLTAYMEGLRTEQQAGRISTAQYEQRLRFLQQLARSHSRDALRRIGAL
ncbi:MAG: hypothetical protein AAFP99_09860 [Pseudomonadota bacterium]